jgi:hypothetical protein
LRPQIDDSYEIEGDTFTLYYKIRYSAFSAFQANTASQANTGSASTGYSAAGEDEYEEDEFESREDTEVDEDYESAGDE